MEGKGRTGKEHTRTTKRITHKTEQTRQDNNRHEAERNEQTQDK